MILKETKAGARCPAPVLRAAAAGTLLLLGLAAGCGDREGAGEDESSGSLSSQTDMADREGHTEAAATMTDKPDEKSEANLADDPRMKAREHLGRVPGERVPTETPTAPTGEVPEAVLGPILADAARRSGVAIDAIVVERAESLIFSDGSLGCPEPGMYYTQATVPGYRIVLDAGGRSLDYRVPERGGFKLCEASAGIEPPQSPDP